MEGKIRLPDIEPHTFQLYLSWLYTGTLAIGSWDVQTPEVAEETLAVIGLYLLADYLDDIALRNNTMTALVTNGVICMPSVETFKMVWEHTPPNSPLRQFYVDLWIAVPSQSQSYTRLPEIASFPSYPEDCRKQILEACMQQRMPPHHSMIEHFRSRLPMYLERYVPGRYDAIPRVCFDGEPRSSWRAVEPPIAPGSSESDVAVSAEAEGVGSGIVLYTKELTF